jgi:hypothetical protein
VKVIEMRVFSDQRMSKLTSAIRAAREKRIGSGVDACFSTRYRLFVGVRVVGVGVRVGLWISQTILCILRRFSDSVGGNIGGVEPAIKAAELR